MSALQECILGNTVFTGLVFLPLFIQGFSQGLMVLGRLAPYVGFTHAFPHPAWLRWLILGAWVPILPILGLFFGMMMGLVAVGYVDEKIKHVLKLEKNPCLHDSRIASLSGSCNQKPENAKNQLSVRYFSRRKTLAVEGKEK